MGRNRLPGKALRDAGRGNRPRRPQRRPKTASSSRHPGLNRPLAACV